MVAAFVRPPGARELTKAPDTNGHVLRNPGFTFSALDQVDKTSWWMIPGSPQAVATYEHAHLPHQFTLGITGSNGITGIAGVTAVTSFELPSVPGILNLRELLLTMVPAADGNTAVRVDAFVAWQPVHPAAEIVPAAARVVTVTLKQGGNDRSKPPGPVTITDPVTVKRLISDIDGLQLDVSGVFSCPADDGRGVQLTFRAQAGGPALAVAFADAMGCGDVTFTIHGTRQPLLQGGAALGQQALAEAGLKWNMRDLLWGHNRLVRFYRVQVLRRMPHPRRGFTQGLLVEGYTVFESVGLYGESVLRRYHPGGDGPVAEAALPEDLFAEGICRVGESIWQLTWRERVALRWDAGTMELRERIRYNREGWGMCAVPGQNGPANQGIAEIVTSDGTSELVRRDPETLEPRDVVHVRVRGDRVRGLNDLTSAGGLVWANVAGSDYLAGIDLATGEVTDVVDAHAAAERQWHDPQAITNGIAALTGPGEFLLTGKRFRSLYQVRLVPDRDRGQVERLLRSGLSR